MEGSTSSASDRPILAGLRVVEISAYVAAPLCGVSLASLGAEVVRIDVPGGGVDYHRWPLHKGRSLYWMGLNEGKRSVTIDIRTDRGRALALDLIAVAGTCITNLPLGEWMSYEQLRKRREDLVMLTIVGNADGSVAVDYTVNAALGFPWITGPESSTGPVNHVLPAWDVVTAHTGVSAVLAAELRRARTGEGANIQLSLADVAISTAARLGLLAEAELELEPRRRYGNYVYGTFGRDFATADGQHVMVVALTPRHWRSLVAATETRDAVSSLEEERGRDFAKEEDRFACRAELAALFEVWIRARSLDAVSTAFDEHGVLWSPYRTFKEFVSGDRRARSSRVLGRVTHPGVGTTIASSSPIAIDGATRRPSAAPELGAQTAEVLHEWLGLTAEQLDDLHGARIIGIEGER